MQVKISILVRNLFNLFPIEYRLQNDLSHIILIMINLKSALNIHRLSHFFIATISDKTSHNPFISLPVHQLLQLAQATKTINDHRSMTFYIHFCNTLIHKNMSTAAGSQTNKSIYIQMNKLVKELTKNMHSINNRELLTLINAVCDGIIKKVFMIQKKLLIEFFAKFQNYLKQNLEEDERGILFQEVRALTPKLLQLRRGVLVLEDILIYLFNFSSTDTQIMDLFRFLSQFHGKSNHIIARNIWNLMERKIMNDLANISSSLVDVLVLEVFSSYHLHYKKPYFSMPIWALEYIERLKQKYTIENDEISFFDKLKFLRILVTLVREDASTVKAFSFPKNQIDFILTYFDSIFDSVEAFSEESLYLKLKAIIEFLPQFYQFLSHHQYLVNFERKEIVEGIFTNYAQQYILSHKFSFEISGKAKMFLQSFLKTSLLMKINFPTRIKKKLYNFLESFIILELKNKNNYLNYLEYLALMTKEQISLPSKQLVDKITELSQSSTNFKVFEVVRMYNACKLMEIEIEAIKNAFYKQKLISGKPIIYSTAAKSMLKTDFNEIIDSFPEISNERGISQYTIEYMILSLKDRYQQQTQMTESLLEYWRSQKRQILSQIDKKLWSYIYHYFYQSKDSDFYEVEFVIECIRINIDNNFEANEILHENIEAFLKHRKLQDFYMKGDDSILQIKYIWLIMCLHRAGKIKDMILDFSAMMFRNGARQQQNKVRLFNKYMFECLNFRKTQKLKHDSHLNVIQMLMNWADMNSQMEDFASIFKHCLVMQNVAEISKKFNHPLRAADICALWEKYLSTSAPYISTQNFKYKKLSQFYQGKTSCEEFEDSQIIEIWLYKHLMAKADPSDVKEALQKLMSIKSSFTFEEFTRIVNNLSSLLKSQSFKDYQKAANKWIKNNFITISKGNSQIYVEDYFWLTNIVGLIPQYEDYLSQNAEKLLLQVNIYIVPQLSKRGLKIDSKVLKTFITKLKKRNFWNFIQDFQFFYELFQQTFIHLFKLVLIHEDAPMINYFLGSVQSSFSLENIKFNRNAQLAICLEISRSLINSESVDILLEVNGLKEGQILNEIQSQQKKLIAQTEFRLSQFQTLKLYQNNKVCYLLYDGRKNGDAINAKFKVRYLSKIFDEQIIPLDVVSLLQ